MSNKSKLIHVRITEEQYEKFLELAVKNDQTRSEFIREVIDKAIRKLKNQGGGD